LNGIATDRHYFSGVGGVVPESSFGSLGAGSGGANSGGVEEAGVDSVVLGGSALDFSMSLPVDSAVFGISPTSTSAAGLSDASEGACPDGITGEVASVVPVVGTATVGTAIVGTAIVGSELMAPDIPPSAGAPIAGPVPDTSLFANAALKSDSVYHQTQKASKKIQQAAATIVIRVNKSPAFVPNAL